MKKDYENVNVYTVYNEVGHDSYFLDEDEAYARAFELAKQDEEYQQNVLVTKEDIDNYIYCVGIEINEAFRRLN
jgi:hypothetical protein